MRIGIIVPHIFMHREILPHVIFSPARLAIDLAEGLQALGADVTLFTPGPVDTSVNNIPADLSLFQEELAGRGYDYVTLLKKHPMTFVTLARQVQSEIVSTAFLMANNHDFDVLHIYSNEEELGLTFAKLCNKPVVFTHHDPFNFLIKYKSVFPKYASLPLISMSYAQRAGMPKSTNWVANIYHGLTPDLYTPTVKPTGGYIAYLGRIIEPKGLHLAIRAVKGYNRTAKTKLQLRIAGKHYAGHIKDTYWQKDIFPQIDGTEIVYDGFLGTAQQKKLFLSNATALLVPSIFNEPFGMVTIESLACGTPVIGLDSGATSEILTSSKIGCIAKKAHFSDGTLDVLTTSNNISTCLKRIPTFDRAECRKQFLDRFTTERMCKEHLETYRKLVA